MSTQDRARMMEALANADAAGDTKAATQLAQMVRDFDAQGSEPDYSKPPAQEPGLGGMIDTPAFTKPDPLRVVTDAFSYGGADTGFGTNAPEETARQRQLTDEARARLGHVAPVYDFAGTLLSPNPMGKLKFAGKGLQTASHAVQGGVQSGVNAYGHGESWPDIGKAALVGSGISGVASTVASPVLNWMARRKARVNAPSSKSLKEQGQQKYEDVKAKGGVYSKRDTRRLLAQFNNMDMSMDVTGEAQDLRRWMSQFKGQELPPDKLDRIRRIVSNKMKKGGDAEKTALGTKFIEGMDKFAENTPVTSATGAPIPGVNDLVKSARKGYQTSYKMGSVEKAEPQKRGPFNVYGEKTEAPSRNRFGALEKKVEKQGALSGWSDAEKAKLAETAKGTVTSAVGELGRRFSPVRNRVMGLTSILATPFTGGTLPIAGIAATEGAAQLGRLSTQKQIGDLKALIANGAVAAADPAKVAAAKETLARLMSAGARTALNQRQAGGPR